MVLSALKCGCLQGLVVQRKRLRVKHDLIEDEAASRHDEDVQAKMKAFYEAKQRQENESKLLQQLEEKAAKKCAAADSEKLNHVELVGRLEKAKAEMEATEQPETAKEAVPQLTKEATSPEDARCLPFEDSTSSLDSTRIDSPHATELEAKNQPEAAKEAASQTKKEGTSPEDVWCLPLEDSSSSLNNTCIESSCTAEMETQEEQEGAKEAALQLKKEITSLEDDRCLPLQHSNLSLDSTQIESPYAAEMDAKEQPEAAKETASQLKNESASLEEVRCLPLEGSNLSLDSTRIESPLAAKPVAQEQPEAAKEAASQLKNESASLEEVRCLPLESSSLSLDNTQIESPLAAESEAKEQPEAAKDASSQRKKEGAAPEDVRCLPLEDSNLSLDTTQIEGPFAAELEAKEQPEAAKEAAQQLTKEGISPEDVQCLPLEGSNLPLDSTRIENPCAAEKEAEEQSEAAKEATPQPKREVTSPKDFEDSNLPLDSTWIETPNAAEMEAEERPDAATEAVSHLKKAGASPDWCLPLEESNSMDSTKIASPYTATSDDAQECAQCPDAPENLTQAMSTTAELPTPCRSLQEDFDLAALGHGMAHGMKPVAEGQCSQVVLQGSKDDAVQIIPQQHEKYPGLEPATEVESLKESAAKSSAPEDQLKSSKLDGRSNRAGVGFGCRAVLASCAVMVITVLAYHATFGSS